VNRGKPSRYDEARRWDTKYRSRSRSTSRSRNRSRSRSWSRSRSRSSRSYSRSRSRSPAKPVFSPTSRKNKKNIKKWKLPAVKGPLVSNARMADRAGRFGNGAAKNAAGTRKTVQVWPSLYSAACVPCQADILARKTLGLVQEVSPTGRRPENS
jgi:hypothetical protein